MYYNANCKVLTPTQTADGTDPLQRDHAESIGTQQRCSLRQMSLAREATVLGAAAAGAWVCRLQSTAAIKPSWRIYACLDGESTWYYYTVRRAAKHFHWSLLLERA